MLKTRTKFKTVNNIVAWVESNRENVSILKVKRKYWRSLRAGDEKMPLGEWREIYYKTFETIEMRRGMIIGKVIFYKINDKWAQCEGKSAGLEIEMKASMKKHLSDKVIIEMLNSIKVS